MKQRSKGPQKGPISKPPGGPVFVSPEGQKRMSLDTAIAQAINGLSKEEAAPIAFSLAATAVPGARLIKRRNWSIH